MWDSAEGLGMLSRVTRLIKSMPIDTWFPLGIYYTDLDESVLYKDIFVKRIKDLYQSSGQRRTEQDYSWTGDIHKVDMLHSDPIFEWLTRNIGLHAYEFLNELGHDLSKVDLYFQRSWPVVGQKGQIVDRHAHHTAHLSAVYYVSIPKEGDPGEIRFFNDKKPNQLYSGISSSMTSGYKSYNELNYGSALYPPIEGRLFLFPSTLTHEVEENMTDEERISISYDLVLTAAENDTQKSPEFLMPSPSKWRKYDLHQTTPPTLQNDLETVPKMMDLPNPSLM